MIKRFVTIASTLLVLVALAVPFTTSQAATPTRIRFINGSTDAGAVDFLIGSPAAVCSGCGDIAFPGTLVNGAKAKGYTSYFTVTGTSVTVTVNATGTSTVIVPATPLTITAGQDNTIALSGTSGTGHVLTSYPDNNTQPPANEVSGRFINLIPNSTLGLTSDLSGVTLTTGIAYRGSSSSGGTYFTLPVGSATFGLSGTLTYTGPRPETLDPTRVYTFFALGDSTNPSTIQILQATDRSFLSKIYLPAILRP